MKNNVDYVNEEEGTNTTVLSTDAQTISAPAPGGGAPKVDANDAEIDLPGGTTPPEELSSPRAEDFDAAAVEAAALGGVVTDAPPGAPTEPGQLPPEPTDLSMAGSVEAVEKAGPNIAPGVVVKEATVPSGVVGDLRLAAGDLFADESKREATEFLDKKTTALAEGAEAVDFVLEALGVEKSAMATHELESLRLAVETALNGVIDNARDRIVGTKPVDVVRPDTPAPAPIPDRMQTDAFPDGDIQFGYLPSTVHVGARMRNMLASIPDDEALDSLSVGRIRAVLADEPHSLRYITPWNDFTRRRLARLRLALYLDRLLGGADPEAEFDVEDDEPEEIGPPPEEEKAGMRLVDLVRARAARATQAANGAPGGKFSAPPVYAGPTEIQLEEMEHKLESCSVVPIDREAVKEELFDILGRDGPIATADVARVVVMVIGTPFISDQVLANAGAEDLGLRWVPASRKDKTKLHHWQDYKPQGQPSEQGYVFMTCLEKMAARVRLRDAGPMWEKNLLIAARSYEKGFRLPEGGLPWYTFGMASYNRPTDAQIACFYAMYFLSTCLPGSMLEPLPPRLAAAIRRKFRHPGALLNFAAECWTYGLRGGSGMPEEVKVPEDSGAVGSEMAITSESSQIRDSVLQARAPSQPGPTLVPGVDGSQWIKDSVADWKKAVSFGEAIFTGEADALYLPVVQEAYSPGPGRQGVIELTHTGTSLSSTRILTPEGFGSEIIFDYPQDPNNGVAVTQQYGSNTLLDVRSGAGGPTTYAVALKDTPNPGEAFDIGNTLFRARRPAPALTLIPLTRMAEKYQGMGFNGLPIIKWLDLANQYTYEPERMAGATAGTWRANNVGIAAEPGSHYPWTEHFAGATVAFDAYSITTAQYLAYREGEFDLPDDSIFIPLPFRAAAPDEMAAWTLGYIHAPYRHVFFPDVAFEALDQTDGSAIPSGGRFITGHTNLIHNLGPRPVVYVSSDVDPDTDAIEVTVGAVAVAPTPAGAAAGVATVGVNVALDNFMAGDAHEVLSALSECIILHQVNLSSQADKLAALQIHAALSNRVWPMGSLVVDGNDAGYFAVSEYPSVPLVPVNSDLPPVVPGGNNVLTDSVNGDWGSNLGSRALDCMGGLPSQMIEITQDNTLLARTVMIVTLDREAELLLAAGVLRMAGKAVADKFVILTDIAEMTRVGRELARGLMLRTAVKGRYTGAGTFANIAAIYNSRADTAHWRAWRSVLAEACVYVTTVTGVMIKSNLDQPFSAEPIANAVFRGNDLMPLRYAELLKVFPFPTFPSTIHGYGFQMMSHAGRIILQATSLQTVMRYGLALLGGPVNDRFANWALINPPGGNVLPPRFRVVYVGAGAGFWTSENYQDSLPGLQSVVEARLTPYAVPDFRAFGVFNFIRFNSGVAVAATDSLVSKGTLDMGRVVEQMFTQLNESDAMPLPLDL